VVRRRHGAPRRVQSACAAGSQLDGFDVLSGVPHRRRNFLGHTVDRLLADQRVGAGVEIEGNQLAGQTLRILMVGIHDGDPIIVIALIS